VSWQLGAITTDVTTSDAGLLHGNPWVLTSTMSDPVTHLDAMIDVGTAGGQPEAGLAAAMLALSSPLVDEANRGIRRPDASLHVVIISDGNDSSDETLGQDATAAFATFLDATSLISGEPSRLSALVGPDPYGCAGSTGTALSGSRYLDVATASGGYTGSICDPNIQALGDWIADASRPEQPRFPLQAVPRPASIRVQVEGERWDDGWDHIDEPPAIQFTRTPPTGAEILIRYQVQSS